MPASSSARPLRRRWFGSRSERSAARYLRKQGFRIIARNWSTPQGELDIVAVGRRLHSVRPSPLHRWVTTPSVAPASSVGDFAKQKQLTRMSLQYLQAKNLLGRDARFDVLAISWPAGTPEPTIEHLRIAFEPTDRFQFYS